MLKAKTPGAVHTHTHTHTHTQVVLNNIFLKIINRMKNKDLCYGLRLLYLRI